jgi:putative tryptophan/tyrosine transport system substrate-binding protein
MRRREFITGVGSTAATWPLPLSAQQVGRVRHIGIMLPFIENDPAAKTWLSKFVQGLRDLGWAEGVNLRIDLRWSPGSADQSRIYAKELVSLQPDALFVDSTPQTASHQRETRTIPIVFALVSDPIGSGFVASLSHPGGNITGFTHLEPSMVGKWLELLTEIAPSIKRVAMMFNPDTAPYVKSYYLLSFEAAARALKVEPIVAPVHSGDEVELAMASLGHQPGGGLVAVPDTFLTNHRAQIILQAARNNVPVVYQIFLWVREGGLLCYGADFGDIYRRAASYVDRILRGEKPADLPVQLPVKFEMALNAKTAKALGLTVPQSILLRADEVIE